MSTNDNTMNNTTIKNNNIMNNNNDSNNSNNDNSNNNNSAANNSTSATEIVGEKRRPRRGIRDNDKKKFKAMPRCTSPSHFVTDANTKHLKVSPRDSLRPDEFLASIADIYFRPRLPLVDGLYNRTNDKVTGNNINGTAMPSSSSAASNKLATENGATNVPAAVTSSASGISGLSAAEVWVSSEYDRTEYSTIDLLLSPLRKESALDKWSAKEIALFEAGICTFGKEFHNIARLMPNKTTAECVDFYYLWKKSGHYALWKEYGKPVRRLAHGKEEQWKLQQDKMKSFRSISPVIGSSTNSDSSNNGKANHS